MIRRLLVALGLAVLALPVVGARAMDMPASQVQISYSAFGPRQTDVVTGDRVTWTNASAREHTVTADDGSFDSGRLAPRRAFTQTFAQAGTVTYHCSLHAFMTGTVAVHDVLLDGAPPPVTPHSSVRLSGREAAGLGAVSILDAHGAAVAHAAPDAMGHFSASFVPATSGSYVASAGGHTSPAVVVTVRDLRVRTVVAGRTVRVWLDPARRGARILLEYRSREHFGWWPLARRRTDAHGRARFRVPGRADQHVRALVVAADDWTPVATGPTVRVPRIKSHARRRTN